MKRDLDLVRSILLAMEEYEHGYASGDLKIDGYTEEQIGYHVYIMGQAGLLTAAENTTIGSLSPSAIPLNLTWAGHDFLDSVKDETLWQKAKSVVIKPATGIAFDVLVSWLKAEASQRLGLS